MSGKVFVYENIRLNDDRTSVFFDYRIITDESIYDLTETITLPASLPESQTVDRVLRALHLALGISYYKTFLPPEIHHSYKMDEQEASFWNGVFRNGLGEFLYKNGLSADRLATFQAQEGSIVPGRNDDIEWNEHVLLGIGGGKDSIVAGELAQDLEMQVDGFVLATGNNTGQAQAVANVMGVKLHRIERTIDRRILELNSLPGAYNGHIPISLVFALTGCLLACLSGNRYVVVANEASASIPQVQHEGKEVNHQWSKSLPFERIFQAFVHEQLSEKLSYFSIIRPLGSVAVAKLFSHYPQYFEVFTSDNSHFKIKKEGETERPRWSHDSPKTLSSFILLAPWMSDADLERTFGANVLNDATLVNLFMKLLGNDAEVVLDCVGTPEELRLSLSLLKKQQRFMDSVLMQKAQQERLLVDNPDDSLHNALSLSDEHCLPENLSSRIMNHIGEMLR